MFGRYMAFAIVAIGLDLIWGYCGILSLAQSFFFALGGYAIGFYLTFQGDLFNGIPEALYVVYPYEVGQSRGTEVLPWFWVPFRRFVPAVVLGLAISRSSRKRSPWRRRSFSVRTKTSSPAPTG